MKRIFFVFIALTALAACDYGTGSSNGYDTDYRASTGGGEGSDGY
jgi:hypothetical protein